MNVKKNISLIFTLVIIVIAGIGGYYLINLKKGPYPASDLLSISYKWGVGDTLVNSYDSATGNYQYLDNRDSLIQTKLKLKANNFIFLHSKANEAELWKLPDIIANPNENHQSSQVLRYEIIFKYTEKSKKIIFMTDYNEDLAVAKSVAQIQSAIAQTLNEMEANK
jgi:hypothetical protein